MLDMQNINFAKERKRSRKVVEKGIREKKRNIHGRGGGKEGVLISRSRKTSEIFLRN